jgi:hypothetical protein
MDTASFVVLITALALIALGVYGAAPWLFVRRDSGASDGGAFLGNGPLPVIEGDLLKGFSPRGSGPVVEFEAAGYLDEETFEAAEEDDALESMPMGSGIERPLDLDSPTPLPHSPAPVRGRQSAELLVERLFREVELMRTQLEALRRELAALTALRVASETPQPATPPRRRAQKRGAAATKTRPSSH